MTRPTLPSDRDLQALLAAAKAIEPVPSSVRSRVLARARQLAANTPPSTPSVAQRQRRPRALVVALVAAAAALVISIAGAVVSLRHAPDTRTVASAGFIQSAAGAQPVLAPAPLPEPTAPVPSDSAAGAERPAPAKIPARESYAAELELLRSAQTSYASHDYASALALLAEHARRFPIGRLAEEREALRVRSLEASGRAEEARRAAAAFAARFPRSVLLTRGVAKPAASQ